jgi:hypothetical protein
MAERVGFEPGPGIEDTEVTDFSCRPCRWNRSNCRSEVQFRYRWLANLPNVIAFGTIRIGRTRVGGSAHLLPQDPSRLL